MNKIYTFLIVLLMLFSCNSIDKPKKPKNLISKSKMVNIIVDISLLNAAKGVDKNLLEKEGVNPEKYVFEKYNIDSLQFAESSNYYAYDVKSYEDIYIKAKQELESRKKAFQEEEELNKKKRDSIREANKNKKSKLKKKVINDSTISSPLKRDRKFPQ